MDIKTWLGVARQRITENELVLHAGLSALACRGFLEALCGKRTAALKSLSQVHRSTRWKSIQRLVEPYILANLDGFPQIPQVKSSKTLPKLFGKRIAVLKAPQPNGEKGVLFVMFTEVFQELQSGMDMPRLLQDYTLVLEPSWSGYCYADMMAFTRWEHEVFVLAAEARDFAFLTRMRSNLVPLTIGPCDWVDPRVAEPHLGQAKQFDIVINSSWATYKRHFVLFQMLRNSKRRFSALLIGVPWYGRTRADLEHLADYYGVRDQVTIMERLPYQRVMELSCQSRVSILLSLKEGSNRAIAEGIFCDLPVVILEPHVGGIRKNVVPETGLIVPETSLASAIGQLIAADLHPRAWGMKNISAFVTSETLNSNLREHALSAGRPWTQDIAGRCSRPESEYLSAEDAQALAPWNTSLSQYLL